MTSKTSAAKKFSAEYLELKEAEKLTVSRIINKLLQVNLLSAKKVNDANDYRFILAYREIFEAYFALSDFELIIDRHEMVVHIVNQQVFNHLRLRKEESILILVIRIIFQRKKDFVTLDENVEIFLSEIHEELTRVGYLDNKRITKDRLKPHLGMLRGYNIIDYVDKNLRDDARIKIYPTILHVTNLDSIKEVVDLYEQYIKSSEESNEEVNQD
jgi:hypothetical protein